MRGLAVLLVFLVSTVAHAREPRERSQQSRPLSKSERRALQAARGGCAKICQQHQACVAQRCVSRCRPACRVGAYCTEEGECQPLPEPEQPIVTEMDRQRLRGAESRDAKAAFFVDWGGALGFGLRPTIEWGEDNAVLARVHLLNTGVMSYAAFGENEFQKFDWGFATSISYRSYEATHGHMRGFFFGGGIEVSGIRVVSRGSAEVSQLLFSAAPFGEFGYRWVFGSMIVGFGPNLALRYPVASGVFGRDEDLCLGDPDCENSNRRRFEGTMQFELGWFL